MNDSLGDRMKEQYEDRTRIFLPRRTNTIIRVDGKAFHSFTRGFERPFSDHLIYAMDRTMLHLCKAIQGAKFGFVQSDEISILATDYDTIQTSAHFNGNLQKICSTSAACATAAFNQALFEYTAGEGKLYAPATFDARAFTIPDVDEVINYFIWRQQDATRNSVQQLAQSLYSQRELHGKNNSQLQEMTHAKGHNWNDLKARYKRGAGCWRRPSAGYAEPRTEWFVDPGTPIFSGSRWYVANHLPDAAWTSKPLVDVAAVSGEQEDTAIHE